MRTGRPKSFSISLNDREREELGNLARSRSLPHALVRRAKIILFADQGWSNTDIAEQLEISLPTVTPVVSPLFGARAGRAL